MTDLELIAIFAGSWTLAAAIWMLLDWAARPKHARFRPKGDRIHRGPFSYRHFRRVRRAEENEEIRLRVEQRYGRPTLALRPKRRSKVMARHDRMVRGIADQSVEEAPIPVPVGELDAAAEAEPVVDDTISEPVYWTQLRDQSMGFDTENLDRLANGQAPTRYNPLLKAHETMVFDGTTASWPSQTTDPFADGVEAAVTDDAEVLDDVDPGSADDDSAIGRAVRDLEHLPEAG